MGVEMMTMVFAWIAYELAGIWPIIWHFGIGGVLLAGCAAGWYFSPVHKIDFIWAAVVIIVVMVATSIGVSLGEKRRQAQWDAAASATLEQAQSARANAVRDVARKPSRWLRHQPNDRYDCDRHPDPLCGVASHPLQTQK